LLEAPPAQESATPSASISVVKSKLPAGVTPAVPAVAAVPEKIAENPAAEQLALLRKPEPVGVEKKPLARRVAKPLEGFIIQIAFTDKEKAQNWAEKMEQRGYAVSVTEAGATGALRVRLGNFSARDDAERQLRSFKQEGMNGIVINLPQAFRPVAQSSVP
jgi:cell division septation protein DedD